MKNTVFIFVFAFVVCTISLRGQDSFMHLTFGYSIAKYDMPMVDKIISEQNQKLASNYSNLLGYKVLHYYTHPKYYKGMSVGLVASTKFWANSIGISSRSFTTYSDGVANITSSDNFWANSLRFRHTNFYYQIQYNLIHAKYFQAGPGIGLDFSFLTAYVKNGEKISHAAYVEKSNSFGMDGTAFFTLIFGKKFQFFVKPYIQYSLFKYNLWDIESYLNTNPEYSKEECKFKINNLGIGFVIGFGR